MGRKSKIDYNIRVQRLKISKNRHFVFRFTSLPVLPAFDRYFQPEVDDVER